MSWYMGSGCDVGSQSWENIVVDGRWLIGAPVEIPGAEEEAPRGVQAGASRARRLRQGFKESVERRSREMPQQGDTERVLGEVDELRDELVEAVSQATPQEQIAPRLRAFAASTHKTLPPKEAIASTSAIRREAF